MIIVMWTYFNFLTAELIGTQVEMAIKLIKVC